LSTSEKPAVPEPEKIAGRYQIVQKLGAGAFGQVFKAKDEILGRMVAIKTIRLEGLAAAGAGLDELMDRFKREAQVSAQLKHPNIVTIYDIGDADGQSYLAMEFIDGVGLERVIASAGRLSLERAASIGAQVADALDFAHKHSVVHRDIKPANIMIEAGDRVKVTDFGIAKVTNSGEHLTMTGSLLGTPSYMSPEQARGGEIDGRSDLFSVGCVLYEMLAGQKAFRGDSITALIFKIITEEPPPLQSFDPTVPEAMVRIIAKALAKSPETRYQSGRELTEDLLPFTKPGSTPTVRLTETPTERSSPGAMAASPTIATPPTLGTSAPTRIAPTVQAPPPLPAAARPGAPRLQAQPPAAAVPPPVPAKKGSSTGLLVVLGLGFLAFAGIALAAGWYLFIRKPAVEVVSTAPSTTIAEPATTLAAAPPPTEAEVTPQTTLPAATLPPATTPPVRTADAGQRDVRPPARPTAPVAPVAPPETQGRTAAPDESFLDEEPPAMDGTEAGRRLADAYRSGTTSGAPYGGNARFRERERSPRNLAPVERPAVAAMRHVMNAQDAFQRKSGHYGTFAELKSSQTLLLDVPIQERSFQRKGYRFELTVERDGFKVVATPVAPGGRPFIGDDSGFIRAGLD
jgi:serine/threonine protein kinase